MSNKRKTHIATTQITYPPGALQHAAKLAQEFAEVYNNMQRPKSHRCRLPGTIKQEMRKRAERVVETGLSKGLCPKFSSNEDRATFQSLIFNMLCDVHYYTVPQEMFDALDQSFKCLVPKI